ncbi:hypothetical protein B0J11DRAFT_608255 [Dendryphion nanum]|uniref:Uncharacterized protein n=1 Tax=Dendryphion nanum TaxID=256645 RepID=A0A9P9IKI3_9PLEO|nr:hypothetical protein B0J11DRAFT_608255 [Dendryphion nanum]
MLEVITVTDQLAINLSMGSGLSMIEQLGLQRTKTSGQPTPKSTTKRKHKASANQQPQPNICCFFPRRPSAIAEAATSKKRTDFSSSAEDGAKATGKERTSFAINTSSGAPNSLKEQTIRTYDQGRTWNLIVIQDIVVTEKFIVAQSFFVGYRIITRRSFVIMQSLIAGRTIVASRNFIVRQDTIFRYSDVWWARLEIYECLFIIQMNPGPSISTLNKLCSLGYRMRHRDSGQLSFGRGRTGQITFEDERSVEGTLSNVFMLGEDEEKPMEESIRFKGNGMELLGWHMAVMKR